MRSAVAGYLSGSALRRRLLSGSAWALGGKIAAAAIGLVTLGVLTRLLTKQEVGVYLLAFSIISVGAVIGSLGLPKTVLRFVAENMTLGQPGRARKAIYTALGLGVVGALCISLAYFFVVGDLVSSYLFHSPALVAVIGLTAGWMAISAMQEIMAETFRGFHDIRMATLFGGLATGGKSAGLIMRVLLLACLVLLLATVGHTDLRTVMLVSVCSGAASGLLSVLFLRKRISSLGTQGTENPISAGEELRDAFPILIISLTSFILLSAADLWILGYFGSKDEVAVYGVASRLVTFIAMPLLLTNLVLPPIIAEMYAQGSTGQLERTLRSFSTLSGVPSLLVLIVFMLLGAPILRLVYGAEMFPAGSLAISQGAIVLVLLSAGKLAAVWAGSCGAVLQFTGHQGSMLRINLLTSPLFIVGALLVVRDYGPVGIASMTAAITVVQNAALVLVAKKKTGMWTHVSLSPSRLRKGLSKR
ncbi:MAG: lipopolysaccharide biosynthesis protein [Rubrobacter sp.]